MSDTHTIRFHRIIKAPPERIYRAFLDPGALAKWLPPHGYTCTVHALDARVEGRFAMTFTQFATGAGHSFGGQYIELAPGERICYTDVFDDPNLPGTLTTRISMAPVSVGTELQILQEGIPAVIPPEACYLGWQESLALLALLVEAPCPT